MFSNSLRNFLLIIYFSITVQNESVYCHPETTDDKLILNPHELVNLIINDRYVKDNHDHGLVFPKKMPGEATFTTNTSVTDKISEPSPLERRKVWSRWSKWGECSVSCGGGYIRRQRVCVAGRCAPGEREEQRRVCAREPCARVPTLLLDEAID